MGSDDLTVLAVLDLALDELVAGRETPAAGEAGALAVLAGALQAAVPAAPPGAAEQGRAAFLVKAAEQPRSGPSRRARWRRSLPVRVLALAAALLLLAVPAAVARQARPGTSLWPLRQAGQQVRLALASDPVHQAHLRLNTAQAFLAAGAGAGEERRKDLADQARDQIKAALDTLDDVAGPSAAAERSRAGQLLAEAEALKDSDEDRDDRSGPGSGSADDRSGPGGGEDRSGGGGGGSADDGSGSGSGSSGSGSGSGSSGSGSSGSRSGSGSGSGSSGDD